VSGASARTPLSSARVVVAHVPEPGAPPTESELRSGFLAGEESIFAPDAAVPRPPTPREAALIRQVEDGMRAEQVPDYETMLAEAAEPEEIIVGLVSTEEALRRERELEQARFEETQAEAQRFHDRELALVNAERKARARVLEEEKVAKARLRRREAQAAARALEREQALHRVFSRAEAHLKEVFRAQQATVEERIGTLEPGRAGARKLRVQWDRLPQPLEVHVHRIRALKDKVPKGNYVLLATPYDRLGGEPLQWTKLARGGGLEESQAPATHPKYHHGRFYDTDLVVDDSFFAVAPAPTDIHPSNVFILELFLLGTTRNPVDRVVAWGALPMCDPDFRAVTGSFQLPLLAGEVDLNVDKYAAMESAVARDLGAWLANVYLEVRHMPRTYVDEGGVRRGEFDLELAFTSEVLRLPSDMRQRAGGAESDDSDDSDGSEEGADGGRAGGGAAERKDGGARMTDPHGYSSTPRTVGDEERPLLRRRARKGRGGAGGAAGGDGGVGTTHGGFLSGAVGGGAPKADMGGAAGGGSQRALLAQVGSRSFTHRRTGSKRHLFGAAGNVARLAVETTSPARTVGAAPGSARTSHSVWRGGRHRRTDTRATAATSATAATNRTAATRGASTAFGGAAHHDEIAHMTNKASYAVSRMDTRAMRRHRMAESVRKMRYLQHELISDLRPSRFSSGEFGVQVGVLLVALWLRIYVHYMGQWLYLRTLRVPVYEFSPLPLSMIVKYVSAVLPVETEIGVTIMGQLSVVVFLVFMVAVAATSSRVLGHFPEISSRFVAFFGLGACLDGLLVTAIDLISGNYNCDARPECADVASPACSCTEGDAFRLYYRFQRDEGSGIIGGFLTAFLFMAMFMLAAFVLYLFLLHVHLDGRMLDVYRRLNGMESAFFVPHDFELSPEELRWIVTKARKWRGARGVHKRIAVCTYELTDPLDPAFQEVTTHLIIYKAATEGGSRELHRHFIRLPDGAILEMFGSFDKHFGSQFKELESLLMAHGKEEEKDVEGFFDGLQFGRV